MEFIKNRTCLRIRKTNDLDMEITFKGRFNALTNLYSKSELNNVFFKYYFTIIDLKYNIALT